MFLIKSQHPRNGVTSTLLHCMHSSLPNPRLPEVVGGHRCSWNVNESWGSSAGKWRKAWQCGWAYGHTQTHTSIYEYHLKGSAMPPPRSQPGISSCWQFQMGSSGSRAGAQSVWQSDLLQVRPCRSEVFSHKPRNGHSYHSWRGKERSPLRACRGSASLLSPGFLASRTVKKEISVALRHPICLGTC